MNKTVIAFIGSTALAASASVFAHHTGAMFDNTKTETIQGTVKVFQFTNPHGFIFVDVPDANGKPVEYSIELTSPNLLARRGWRPSSLKVGEKVTVVLNPFRDGKKGGRIVSVTNSEGKNLSERGPQ